MHKTLGIWALTLSAGLNSYLAQADTLDHLKIPEGFQIETFAEVANARQLAQSNSGIVYAGSREAGRVYAVIDKDGDWRAEHTLVIADQLDMPSGIALYQGDLYIAAVDTIYRIQNVDHAVAILQKNGERPELEVFDNNWPREHHHGWKYLEAFTDEQGRGQLIVPVGAPCNICDKGLPYAALWRLDLTTKAKLPIAQGVRNSVGLAIDPASGDLWFSDNGRDGLGDNLPDDELNYLLKSELRGIEVKPGELRPTKLPHYGYPYVHSRDTPDPEFNPEAGGRALPAGLPHFRPTRHKIPAHFAPLGIVFYTGEQFPSSYSGSLLVAEHGSHNRSVPGGYRVTQVVLGSAKLPLDYRVLVDGFLELEGTPEKFSHKIHGRPADVLVASDGSVLISDDYAGRIYRLSYRETKLTDSD